MTEALTGSSLAVIGPEARFPGTLLVGNLVNEGKRKDRIIAGRFRLVTWILPFRGS